MIYLSYIYIEKNMPNTHPISEEKSGVWHHLENKEPEEHPTLIL